MIEKNKISEIFPMLLVGFNSGVKTKLPFSTIFRRWFDWDPRLTRRNGKPAITGTKAAYVASEIPVVLLRDVDNLGPKGAIVTVKRGYARNILVPSGIAVYGTLWENIDAFADADVVKKQQVAHEAASTVKERAPFDWLNSVRIEFQRETRDNRLEDPVTLEEILEQISDQESVDFLPSQILNFPSSGITTVGRHDLHVVLNLTIGNFTYIAKVEVKDKAEVLAAERRETELKEAMKIKRPTFALGEKKISHENDSDEED